MAAHVYLRMLNDDLVSHCHCAKVDAVISSPTQMDCPWCGCGWMFICSDCGKAFTFAEAFETTESLEQIATRLLSRSYRRMPTPEELNEWIEFVEIFLKDIRPRQHYVYFDGYVISTEEAGVRLDGLYSRHDLGFVPQVAARSDSRISAEILESVDYWRSTAIDEKQG